MVRNCIAGGIVMVAGALFLLVPSPAVQELPDLSTVRGGDGSCQYPARKYWCHECNPANQRKCDGPEDKGFYQCQLITGPNVSCSTSADGSCDGPATRYEVCTTGIIDFDDDCPNPKNTYTVTPQPGYCI